jgi:hypothetical protein
MDFFSIIIFYFDSAIKMPLAWQAKFKIKCQHCDIKRISLTDFAGYVCCRTCYKKIYQRYYDNRPQANSVDELAFDEALEKLFNDPLNLEAAILEAKNTRNLSWYISLVRKLK